MTALSIPEVERQERRSDLLIRVLIPSAVALVFIGVLIGERDAPRYDLQLSAPRDAPPGAPIAFRGTLIDENDPVLALLNAPVRVELRGGGAVLAEVDATVSRTQGFEGSIIIPESAPHEELTLLATAQIGEERAVVSRPIRVSPLARDEPVEVRGRLQTELQQYSLGRLEKEAEGQWHLDLRVLGGACQPELRCEALIWVGAPAASVALVRADGVVPAEESECGRLPREFLDEGGELPSSPATDRILHCPFIARGNEATAHVIAHAQGQVVARRSVRIPIMLGSPMVLSQAIAQPDDTLTFEVQRILEEDPYVIDVFHEDHWVRAFSEDKAELSLRLDKAGLWRVQIRRDVYSEPGGQQLVYVGDDPVQRIASHPYQQRWLDPAAREDWSDCQGEYCSPERLARFMLAAGELEVAELPNPTSGGLQDQEGIHGDRGVRRKWAALFIFLGGLIVAFVIVRRTKRASEEARAVMAQAGAEKSGAAEQRRMAITLYSSAFFVVAVFAVVSAMVMARGCH